MHINPWQLKLKSLKQRREYVIDIKSVGSMAESRTNRQKESARMLPCMTCPAEHLRGAQHHVSSEGMRMKLIGTHEDYFGR